MRRRGFTMTELLVVIAIIVVLIGLVSPMAARAWKQGQRTRTAADLQAIASALEAYRQDHGDYPEIGMPPRPVPYQDFNGARWLCQALVAPRRAAPTSTADGDGADGPGFRTRGMSGKVWGPYLRPEQFKLGNPSRGPAATDNEAYLTLFDKNNKPILYYRAVGKPNIRLPRGYVGTNPPDKAMYNTWDNMDSANRGGLRFDQLAMMLGDTNVNGGIDPGETPAHEGSYLLWSAGPDEVFGPDASLPPGSRDPAAIKKAVQRSDDITNFR